MMTKFFNKFKKAYFWPILGQFFFLNSGSVMGNFVWILKLFQNSQKPCRSSSKKTSGRKNRQTLFYRTPTLVNRLIWTFCQLQHQKQSKKIIARVFYYD